MLDLSKAFDTVNHPILCKKLERYGVKDGELKWFNDYLTGRNQKVCIGVMQSDMRETRSGVPQGSILGPLLLTIYVNDLRFYFTLGNSMRMIQHCTVPVITP